MVFQSLTRVRLSSLRFSSGRISKGLVLLLFILFHAIPTLNFGVNASLAEDQIQANGQNVFDLENGLYIQNNQPLAILIQHLGASPDHARIDKVCLRQVTRCTEYRYKVVCYVNPLCEVNPFSCFYPPVCHQERYCSKEQDFLENVRYTLNVEFDQASLIKNPSERRYFALKCGGILAEDLEFVSNATDIKIRKRFWNDHIRVIKK